LRNELSACGDDCQHPGVLACPLRWIRGKTALAHCATSACGWNLLRNHSLFGKAPEEFASHCHIPGVDASKDHHETSRRYAGRDRDSCPRRSLDGVTVMSTTVNLLIDKLRTVEARYDELTQQLADPEVVSDSKRYQKTAKAHAELGELVEKFREYKD